MPSPGKPPSFNAAATAETSAQYNKQAAVDSMGLNTVNQKTPIGNLTYTTTIDPVTGLPKYTAHTKLSADQQALLDTLEGTKQSAGTAGKNLMADASGQYSSVQDLIGGANSLTQQGIDRQLPAFERFQKPAREQLDTQLRNQGILPNTPAYHQQMDKLLAQQDLNTGSWMNSFQAQSFDQATREYEEPLNITGKLASLGAPMNLKENLINTPTANVNPVDYGSLAKTQQEAAMAQWQAKVAQQNALMGGIFGLGSAAMGMPAVGGASGLMASLFAGSPGEKGGYSSPG